MEKAWFLRDTNLLGRLKPEDHEVLQRVCPFRTYRAGDLLFQRGQPAHSVHVIVEGHVKLLVPRPNLQPHVLTVLGPDDFAGESFLSPNAHYRADAVVASEHATVCPISREDYLQLAFRAPHFVLSFTEVVVSHLDACHSRLGLTAYPLAVRVAYTLLEEARQSGPVHSSGWVDLQRVLTHDEIASQVNATRTSVTEVISTFRQAGWVRGTRGRYSVRLDSLGELVESTVA